MFWYLVPILAVALVLALFLKEIPLSEHAGMVARGEAVESEEELARLSGRRSQKVVILDGQDDDGSRDGVLAPSGRRADRCVSLPAGGRAVPRRRRQRLRR